MKMEHKPVFTFLFQISFLYVVEIKAYKGYFSV